MFNIGPGELVAILAVALIVLGPNRLPEAVRTAGRVVGELRRISSGFQDELRNALDDSDVIDPVEPVASTNKGTELVDSSAAALVEATASTASPAGSEDMVDDDLDDFGDDLDTPDEPAVASADVPVAASFGADALGTPAGDEHEAVGGPADEPTPEPEPEPETMAATYGADALGTPDVDGGDDGDDDRGPLDHIEALDPGRGAGAEIAAPAGAETSVDSDTDTDTDTTSEPGGDAEAGSETGDRSAAS
jgi:sec-independent protein translocase protein TatB